MSTRARLAAPALAAILLSSHAAAALDDDEALALATEGKKLLAQGKVDAACAKLEESQRKAPQSATLLELATCHEKQGKVASAWIEFGDVAAQARKEGRSDRERTANQRGQALTSKVPRLTLTVSDAVRALDGLEIKIDGHALAKAEIGQSLPIDPGEHLVQASAPGHVDWEARIALKPSEKKAATIPALADKPADQLATTPPPAASTKLDPEKAPPPPPPSSPKVPKHPAKRIVAEVSGFAAFLYGGVNAGSLDELKPLTYPYLAKDAEYLQVCGASNCEASVSPTPSVLGGGQIFVGYATSEKTHIGGRVLGGARAGGGFFLAGGPALSFHLSRPLWLGGSALVGYMKQPAAISGIRGSGPPNIPAADGTDQVQVSLAGAPKEAQVNSGLAFGVSGEISYMLADIATPSGSLMLSAWPTFMLGLHGFVVAVPVGVGYRFY